MIHCIEIVCDDDNDDFVVLCVFEFGECFVIYVNDDDVLATDVDIDNDDAIKAIDAVATNAETAVPTAALFVVLVRIGSELIAVSTNSGLPVYDCYKLV